MTSAPLNMGIIEAFFGRSWSWEDRKSYASFLRENSYQFYIYAPKDDPFLRKLWNEPWPENRRESVKQLANHYHNEGVQFGIGLSPYEIYLDYGKETIRRLDRKIEEIDTVGCDILHILFDDMRGDIPDLASIQVEITHRIAEKSRAKTIVMCPTYYSYDPILIKVFGEMPKNYLEELGKNLDPTIPLLWTGPLVCSSEYSKKHLLEVTEKLRRKPFLWDNYPVNDGAKRSKHLYLEAFENRSCDLSEIISGHGVNPMNQSWLSRIPLKTLPDRYQFGPDYSMETSFQNACEQLCGPELANRIKEDLHLFQYVGLEKMENETKEALIQKYQNHKQSPYAREIIEWLQNKYQFDPACLTE